MSKFDFNINDDRDNSIQELKLLKDRFLLENDRLKSRKLFYLILYSWERISKDLWEFGYWQYYFQGANIVFECTTIIQGDVLNQMGWNYMENAEFARAKSYFKESLRMFKDVSYFYGQCESLRYLGVLYHRQRRFGSALKSYRLALNIITAQENPVRELQVKQQAHLAEIHNLLGNLYLKLSDLTPSLNELLLALEKYRSLGDEYVYYQTAPLINLGRWYLLKGNYQEARKYYKECLQLSHKINRTDTKVGVLYRLAELAQAEGNEKKAIKLTEKALRVSGKEIGIQRDQVARLKEELTGIKSGKISTIHQLIIICTSGLDLAFYAPLTLLRFIIYYLIRLVK